MSGPYAMPVRVSLYITMGWSVIVCIRPVARKLGCKAFSILFLGGVCYTGGVPWFVRNKHTYGVPDHTIWHLFVVAGSLCHYCVICVYVVTEKRRSVISCDG